jgi:formylmethanofuran dehydrogenase subunit E
MPDPESSTPAPALPSNRQLASDLVSNKTGYCDWCNDPFPESELIESGGGDVLCKSCFRATGT